MPPVFIQAVPWEPQRVKNARILMHQTNGTIVWDREFSGFKTYLDVLRTAAVHSLAGDALILEDDVELAPGFASRVEAVIEAHPGVVINFFSTYVRQSSLRSSLYYIANTCHYLPPGVPASVLEYAPHWNEIRRWDNPDQDFLILDWLTLNEQKFWIQVPSLVQHKEWVSVTAEGRPVKRMSPTFKKVNS